MKRLLVLLLLCPMLSMGQRTEWNTAYAKSIPADLGKRIHLPQRDYNPNFSLPGAISYKQSTRIVPIKSDSVYKKLFWRYIYTKDSLEEYKRKDANRYDLHWVEQHLVDSLPVIDFSRYELILYSACAQCLAFCHHDEGHSGCHRNACNYFESWFLRDKMQVVFLPYLSTDELKGFSLVLNSESHFYSVTAKKEYERIFSRYPKDSLPVFDFNRQELLVMVSCAHCAARCGHEDWRWMSCHRDAPMLTSKWYVRDKEVAVN